VRDAWRPDPEVKVPPERLTEGPREPASAPVPLGVGVAGWEVVFSWAMISLSYWTIYGWT